MSKNKAAIFLALLAAALYAVNIPFSKILLSHIQPTMLAGFLYMGAGIGVGAIMLTKKLMNKPHCENRLEKSDLPYTIAMILLDIAAPIFLMFGIVNTTSANVSLLNNFEIVATSLIALAVFGEKITKKLWLSIFLVTLSSIILAFEGSSSFIFNKGSAFVICACICWGIENNCTRKISDKSSEEIVLLKGIFSGLGSIIIALIIGETIPSVHYVLIAMLLGFVAYGLSIDTYIKAQNVLGAAKTSAFYSIAPFLGVGFSFVMLGEVPKPQFYLALLIMAIGTVTMIQDTLGNEKILNEYNHSHEHRHGTHTHTHEHRHYTVNPIHIHLHTH